MYIEKIPALKIHKLTQEQYDRELAANNIDENAIYLTPHKDVDLSGYATKAELNNTAALVYNSISSISDDDIVNLF